MKATADLIYEIEPTNEELIEFGERIEDSEEFKRFDPLVTRDPEGISIVLHFDNVNDLDEVIKQAAVIGRQMVPFREPKQVQYEEIIERVEAKP